MTFILLPNEKQDFLKSVANQTTSAPLYGHKPTDSYLKICFILFIIQVFTDMRLHDDDGMFIWCFDERNICSSSVFVYTFLNCLSLACFVQYEF